MTERGIWSSATILGPSLPETCSSRQPESFTASRGFSEDLETWVFIHGPEGEEPEGPGI